LTNIDKFSSHAGDLFWPPDLDDFQDEFSNYYPEIMPQVRSVSKLRYFQI
jgi:hypothetical protein